MLVLLAYEVYYEKSGTDKSDWSVQTSYALKYRAAYTRAFKRGVTYVWNEGTLPQAQPLLLE